MIKKGVSKALKLCLKPVISSNCWGWAQDIWVFSDCVRKSGNFRDLLSWRLSINFGGILKPVSPHSFFHLTRLSCSHKMSAILWIYVQPKRQRHWGVHRRCSSKDVQRLGAPGKINLSPLVSSEHVRHSRNTCFSQSHPVGSSVSWPQVTACCWRLSEEPPRGSHICLLPPHCPCYCLFLKACYLLEVIYHSFQEKVIGKTFPIAQNPWLPRGLAWWKSIRWELISLGLVRKNCALCLGLADSLGVS